MIAPQQFVWSAENSVMVPLRRTLADKVYVDGETYRLAVEEERSMASHNHYFSAIADVHENLDDAMTLILPTPEHLRKYALIKCGFYKVAEHVFSTPADAAKFGYVIRLMDPFSVVQIKLNCAQIFTAQSQSKSAMGAAQFKESKRRVLEYLETLIEARERETVAGGKE
jgi:hypothetical protein